MINAALIKTEAKSETDFFAPIKLEEMERVKLMNRTDTKYWFNQSRLEELLGAVYTDYFVLTMNDEISLPYSTVYFDTPENRMFNAHQNGKLNRYKIRRRSYVSSGISFLEVKFKNNKGRTIKKRIPGSFEPLGFNGGEIEFLKKQTPYIPENLQPSLKNNFSRITLVNKNFRERCTIDFNLQYETANCSISLNQLVIVEIKTEGSPAESPLARALRNLRIKKSGFSKYCVGRTVTDPSLKRNAFKQKIRSIEKTIPTEKNLYN